MPVTKRFEVNHYLEDFEELDEHSSFIVPNRLEAEELLFKERTTPDFPFWKKWWTTLSSFFSKL